MKSLLISHVDLDGVSPNVLMNLTGEKFEYKNIEISEIDNTFDEYFKKDMKRYKNIYIVDLSLTQHAYDLINNNNLNNIHVFDHHATHLFANDYPYVEVKVDINGIKTCGTELFYNHLKEEYKELNKQNIKEYVELVRQLDTYDFKDKESAINLDHLHEVLGHKGFVDTITKRLKKNKEHFEFTQFEKRLFKIEQNRTNRYMQLKDKDMIRATIDKYKVGIVFAESNKSETGNYLSNKYNDLDLIILIDASSRISYRTSRDDIDVAKFAETYGGGGHKKSSGSKFDNNDRISIIKSYYKEVKIEEK